MKAKKIVVTLSLIVTLTGLIVIGGWVFDVSALKSILPIWVSMKFTTALCFVVSGISLRFMVKVFENDVDASLIVLSISTYIILLIMAILLISTIIGVRTGIEDLFVRDSINAALTITPGRLSLGTMLSFVLVAVSSVFVMLDVSLSRSWLPRLGCAILLLAVLSLTGYALNKPVLYFHWEGVSTGMAFHSAILFVLLGVSLTRAVHCK